ncbi:MAG: glycogen debranching protein, partial [Syntrophus sp. (in: bacteria)]|nr:glycogen debranching protein [Syntrophus sp. (in: bacteria)]
LRTLSPADPAYRGRYGGNGAERDAAYHQGTVWPWLLGPFGEAALRVAEDQKQEKEFLKRHLRSFLRNHLREAGIGSVSEVFDGDPPHRPGGCIAQAWSVAELIRLFLLLR